MDKISSFLPISHFFVALFMPHSTILPHWEMGNWSLDQFLRNLFRKELQPICRWLWWDVEKQVSMKCVSLVLTSLNSYSQDNILSLFWQADNWRIAVLEILLPLMSFDLRTLCCHMWELQAVFKKQPEGNRSVEWVVILGQNLLGWTSLWLNLPCLHSLKSKKKMDYGTVGRPSSKHFGRRGEI